VTASISAARATWQRAGAVLATAILVAACGASASTLAPASSSGSGASQAALAELSTVELEATVDGLRGPAQIAASRDAVWALAHESGELIRIDPATNTVTATISLGGGAANGLGIIGTKVWAFAQIAGEIVRTDMATNKIDKRIKLGHDGDLFWTGPDAAFMVTEGSVYRIDPDTAEPTKLGPIQCAWDGVAASPGFIWFGSTDGTVCKIDAATGKVAARGSDLGVATAMAVVGDRLWLASHGGGLSVVDPATMKVVTDVPAPAKGTFQGSTYSLGIPGGETTVIVGNADGHSGWLRFTGGTIGRVALDASPSITLFAGFPGDTLAGQVVEAFGSLWVTNFGAGTVTRYKLSTS